MEIYNGNLLRYNITMAIQSGDPTPDHRPSQRVRHESFPVVEATRHGRIALHPVQDGQMDPGGVTLALDSQISRSELEGHPMIRYLLACGWTLRSLIEETHWTLTPPDWVQRQ